jgi:hypothetical protein
MKKRNVHVHNTRPCARRGPESSVTDDEASHWDENEQREETRSERRAAELWSPLAAHRRCGPLSLVREQHPTVSSAAQQLYRADVQHSGYCLSLLADGTLPARVTRALDGHCVFAWKRLQLSSFGSAGIVGIKRASRMGWLSVSNFS